MNKKNMIAGILLPFVLVLQACSPSLNSSDLTSASDLTLTQDFSSQLELPGFAGIENAEVVDEAEYYKVLRIHLQYYVCIYDENHVVVKREGPWSRQPQIMMVNDHLVRFTLQAGASLETQWGYYYDVKKDAFSRTFYAIHDQCDGRVAYGCSALVVIRDIFDRAVYYKEISSFKEPFSPSVEPIIEVEFINDGRCIKITYLTGPEYKRVTEIFEL